MKLDSFYFSAFEVKPAEILEYILPFTGEKHDQTLADIKSDCLLALGWLVK